ncbi:MAG: cbb3-type cytochrome c oxidase subunit I, partial [Deltaproteobacteria bacterium]
WGIGHVHSGALGWVAMISIGALYYMIPRVFGKTEMHSTKLINAHFWLATTGVVIYIVAMWISGVMQGLMWRAVNPDGSLTYTFVESVAAMHPYNVMRLIGGLVFFSGMLVMSYNTIKTGSQAQRRVA